MIAHRQEVHALPRNDTNDVDGKPSAAEVAEVNEYSLSQLVPTNDSTTNSNMVTLLDFIQFDKKNLLFLTTIVIRKFI